MLVVADALGLGGRRLDVGGPRGQPVHELARFRLHYQLRAGTEGVGRCTEELL